MSKNYIITKLKNRDSITGIRLYRKSDNTIIELEDYSNGDIRTNISYRWERFKNNSVISGSSTCHVFDLLYRLNTDKLAVIN